MKQNESILSQPEARRLLDYEPATGIFLWRKRERGLPGWSPGWNGKNAGRAAGARMALGYILISILDSKFLAHRVAWLYVHGEWPPEQIDHIDMVRDNNAIANLRLATNSQNTMNRGPQSNNACGIKGVRLHKASGLWNARIAVNGKVHSLGYFKTAEEAGAAHQGALHALHGDFSRTSH